MCLDALLAWSDCHRRRHDVGAQSEIGRPRKFVSGGRNNSPLWTRLIATIPITSASRRASLRTSGDLGARLLVVEVRSENDQ